MKTNVTEYMYTARPCILFPYAKQPFVIFSDFCILYFDRTIFSYIVIVLELVLVILMLIKAMYMYGS